MMRCFNCKGAGHISANCPTRGVEGRKEERPKVKARAFGMNAEEARDNNEVVTGTFLINSKPATVLFDSGANKSFISQIIAAKLDMHAHPLDNVVEVQIADGHTTQINEGYYDCQIEIEGQSFLVELLPVKLANFDVVIGMEL